MLKKITRIGIIGYGLIGKEVHQMIKKSANKNLEIAFIYDIVQEKLKDVERELVLDDLNRFSEKKPDLVIEMAHPEITRKWGTKILEYCDYMFISVTALSDQGMEEKLKKVTKKYGTCAYVPHGGAIGIDAIFENRNVWETISIIMKKPPKNIDYTKVDINPEDIKEETVLYDGPTRGICPLFPRNVNTHAAIAYAGIGFDKTNSLLVVNPAWKVATIALHARSKDIEIKTERIETITGVTGISTPASIYNSLQIATFKDPGIHLC